MSHTDAQNMSHTDAQNMSLTYVFWILRFLDDVSDWSDDTDDDTNNINKVVVKMKNFNVIYF